MTLRLIALALLSCVAPAAAGAERIVAGPVEGEVVRVIDGDTLVVRAVIWIDQVITVTVRVADVDAPEIYKPACAGERDAGEASRLFVEQFFPGGRTRLTDIRNDKYGGRVVARLANAAGEDLTMALLASGHAQPYGKPALCAASR